MLSERIDEWNRKLAEKNLKQGLKEGAKEGRQKGRQEILLRLVEKKFGDLDRHARNRITLAEPDLLLKWTDRLLTAQTLDEVFED